MTEKIDDDQSITAPHVEGIEIRMKSSVAFTVSTNDLEDTQRADCKSGILTLVQLIPSDPPGRSRSQARAKVHDRPRLHEQS